jgi:hypothetical protein
MQSMAKRVRSGENLNVWIRSELVEAVRQYVRATSPRTSKTAVVELALEEFLAKRGVQTNHAVSMPQAGEQKG